MEKLSDSLRSDLCPKVGSKVGSGNARSDHREMTKSCSTIDWLPASEGRILLGCTERIVRLLAAKHSWRTREERCNGGLRKLYARADVLAYMMAKGIRPPDPLGSADPTPVLPPAPPEGASPDPADRTLLNATGKARKEAERRLLVVQAWQRWRRAGGQTDAFIEDLRARTGERIARPTLYRWEALYREHGLDGLVPSPRLRRREGPRVPEQVLAHFDTLYLDQQRRSARLCWEMTREWARGLGLPCPEYDAFKRHVRRIPKHTLVLCRDGEKAYEDQCLPHLVRDYSTLASNEGWVSDHHQVDVAVRGPGGRPCFPWITVFQDLRSRMWVGWAVSVQPSSDTIFLAFRRAVLRYGVPKFLLLDNGKDFRAFDFAGGKRTIHVSVDAGRVTALTTRLEIDIHWARPYNAKAKPIERSFLIVKEWFSKMWPSYRGGNVLEKPERLQGLLRRPDELPTLEEFEQAFGEWVEHVYNQAPCSGHGCDGLRRAEAFERYLGVQRWASEEDLVLACMRTTKPLTVRRNGIRLWDRDYLGECLYPHLGKQVFVRYDVLRPGRIYVFDLEDRYIGAVDRQDLMQWGATAEDMRAGERLKRQARKVTKAYQEELRAQAMEPDPLRRHLESKRQEAGPPSPTPPGVVTLPLQYARDLRQAVGARMDPKTAHDLAGEGLRLLKRKHERELRMQEGG